MPEALAPLKQPETLQETPKLSPVGEIFSAETRDRLPVTVMQIGEFRKQKMPNGEEVEIGDAFAFPCSREWLPTKLGIEEPSEAYTTMRLRLARWLAPIFAMLTGATAVSGCINGISDHGGNANDDISSLNQGLSMDELGMSVTLQEAAFTKGEEPGDWSPNIATFNGQTIITFVRLGYCYHVRAMDILTALQMQNAQKISLPPNDWGSEGGCIIHNNQIIYGGGDLIADLVETADGGLKGENYQILQPNLQLYDKTIAPADDNNDPLLLGTVATGLGLRLKIHNLNTHEATLHMENSTECGTPNRDAEGGAWVQGHYDSYSSGPVHCYIVRATTLQDLSFWPLVRIFSPDGGEAGDIRNPRIAQNVMVFEKRDEKLPRTNPRSLDDPKIYYVIFPTDSADGGIPIEDGGTSNDDGGIPNNDGGIANNDGGVPNADGGVNTNDGGAVPDGGNLQDGGTITDGGTSNPDGGTAIDGGSPTLDGGTAQDGGTARDGGNVPDGGQQHPDGGPSNPDGGPKPDGGNLPDGGSGNTPDGGGSVQDGGTPNPDGGETRPDGGNSHDGGVARDGGQQLSDGGIQQPDGSINGDGEYPQLPPGCCNVSNSNPSNNMASSIVLGIGIALRRVFKRKKNKQ